MALMSICKCAIKKFDMLNVIHVSVMSVMIKFIITGRQSLAALINSILLTIAPEILAVYLLLHTVVFLDHRCRVFLPLCWQYFIFSHFSKITGWSPVILSKMHTLTGSFQVYLFLIFSETMLLFFFNF